MKKTFLVILGCLIPSLVLAVGSLNQYRNTEWIMTNAAGDEAILTFDDMGLSLKTTKKESPEKSFTWWVDRLEYKEKGSLVFPVGRALKDAIVGYMGDQPGFLIYIESDNCLLFPGAAPSKSCFKKIRQ